MAPRPAASCIEQFDWTAVFLINVPIVIAALAATPKLVPDSRDPKQPRLDPVGAVLSTVGLGILTAAIIEAPDWGWTDGRILGGFAAAAVVLAAFVIWELRTASPMLDMRLFRIRRFTGASGAVALVFFALFGAIYFLTQYLQEVLDYTPLQAGVRMLPIAAGLIVGGPLSAKLAGRFGTRNGGRHRADRRRGRAVPALRSRDGQRLLARRRPRSCCSASAWARRWRPLPSRS